MQHPYTGEALIALLVANGRKPPCVVYPVEKPSRRQQLGSQQFAVPHTPATSPLPMQMLRFPPASAETIERRIQPERVPSSPFPESLVADYRQQPAHSYAALMPSVQSARRRKSAATMLLRKTGAAAGSSTGASVGLEMLALKSSFA